MCNQNGEEFGGLRKCKLDGLIYCESCITDLAEQEMYEWMEKNFKKIK